MPSSGEEIETGVLLIRLIDADHVRPASITSRAGVNSPLSRTDADAAGAMQHHECWLGERRLVLRTVISTPVTLIAAMAIPAPLMAKLHRPAEDACRVDLLDPGGQGGPETAAGWQRDRQGPAETASMVIWVFPRRPGSRLLLTR